MITQSKPETSITAGDVWRILLRHKGKAISCFAAVLLLTAGAVYCWPRKFKSEAKLFVQVGRESVTLDPTATTGQVVPVSLSRETEVNSVLEMLHSRIMVEKLVDQIGPNAILRPTTKDSNAAAESPSMMSRLQSLVDIDPVSDREKAITKVAKALTSAVEKKSDVITISGTSTSPALAQQFVSGLVDVYLGEHAKIHRTAGSQAFFAEQTALLKKSVNDTLAKLRDAKNSMGILSVESQREILRDETVAVESKLAQAQSALAASKQKVASLREKVKVVPVRLATEEVKGYPNAAADSMRQDLYQLEIKEAELASRFTDEFPGLKAVRAQIATAKMPLNREDQRRTQQTTTVNQVHDQLNVNMMTEESNTASLEAEARALDGQLAQLRDRAKLLNEHELQIAALEQELTLSKANYTTYCEKSEQSRIDAALQNERITNVNVIQPANLVERPVSPQKGLLLAAGVLGGLVLSIGVALLAEYRDPALMATSEPDDRLSKPVLAPMPEVAPRHTVLN